MKVSRMLIFLGIILVLGACALTGYNLWSEKSAGEKAEAAYEKIEKIISVNAETKESESDGKEDPVISFPDYVLNPEMDMPYEEIDGIEYIGCLEIPKLDITLPIGRELSYPTLRTAPCRYVGSTYLDDMIIAAHNYNTHFGRLSELSQGDVITFTDIDGNVFYYEVFDFEVIDGYAVEDMKSGEWDLTLFTCTLSGRARTAVRCIRQQNDINKMP